MKICVHRVLISEYSEAVVKYMGLEWFSVQGLVQLNQMPCSILSL